MNDPRNDNPRTCPKCQGLGVMWGEYEPLNKEEYMKLPGDEKEGYIEAACEMCEGNGTIPEQQYMEYCEEIVDWDADDLT